MNYSKQATWLPLFTGFYESFFDPSDQFIEMECNLSNEEWRECYSYLHENGVTQEFFNENLCDYINYQSGFIGVCEYVCDALEQLESSDIIKRVDYEKLVSPKYYNFSTDSINCEITYNSKKLIQYLKENQEAFKEYIENKYTSRDGFSSIYSNEIDYWMNKENHGEHEVGSLLQFVLLNEDDEAEMSLYYESNCLEGFMNSVEIDFKKMIEDFKIKKSA